MKILACGDAQRLAAPGESLPSGVYGTVVGLIDLGPNNGLNDFGWSGLKGVIEVDGDWYVLDFPGHARLVTDDGIELTPFDDQEDSTWCPDPSDVQRYGLRWIEHPA